MNGDRDTVYSVKRSLEREDCQVLRARNGWKDLAIMERGGPDLIVTDTRTPVEERKTVPVHQVIDRALTFFMNYWVDKKEIEIRKEYTSHSPMVLADPDQLEQVFLNLALNALQAMSNGGTITVATQTLSHEGADFIKIDFTDTGCGISPENLHRLFEALFTTKGEEGAGLGLYVSRCIIERHGGTIEVRSGLGVGSTFTIKLPTVDSLSPLSLNLQNSNRGAVC